MTNRGKGYTILEVLIFLAVSSFLLIAAMAAMSGRQEEIQFSQSVREFEATINDIINDVATGYYPTGDHIKYCHESPNTAKYSVRFLPTGGEPDFNRSSECIYIGKALQFFPRDNFTDPKSNKKKVNVYNLVGLRKNESGSLATSFNDAKGQIEGNFSGSEDPVVQEVSLSFNVEAYRIVRKAGVPLDKNNTFEGFVVISRFSGNSFAKSSNLSQFVSIGGIWGEASSKDIVEKGRFIGTELEETDANGIDSFRRRFTRPTNNRPAYPGLDVCTNENINCIRTDLDGTNLKNGIVICLRDGDESDYGRIASLTIGANGNNSTDLRIDDHDPDCNKP